jgi:hypothetical protein
MSEASKLIGSMDELTNLYREQRDYLSKELEKVKIERDEAREQLAIAREALRLIAEEGGQTGGSRTIIADGDWCAKYAQITLDDIK